MRHPSARIFSACGKNYTGWPRKKNPFQKMGFFFWAPEFYTKSAKFRGPENNPHFFPLCVRFSKKCACDKFRSPKNNPQIKLELSVFFFTGGIIFWGYFIGPLNFKLRQNGFFFLGHPVCEISTSWALDTT